jgi:hypothetical protein
VRLEEDLLRGGSGEAPSTGAVSLVDCPAVTSEQGYLHELIPHKIISLLSCKRSVLMQEQSVQTPRFTHKQPKNLKKTNRFPSHLLDGTSVAKHSRENTKRVALLLGDGGLGSGGQLISGGTAMGLFSMSSSGNDQFTRVAAPPQLLTPQDTSAIGGVSAPSFGTHEATSTGRLRSNVEGQFRRMFDAHDRIRTKLLSSHLTHAK